jgi:[ribosomal protein S18]-alanine N-acetyltransferase
MMRWFSKHLNIQIREGRVADCAKLADLHSQGFERGWGVTEFENLLCDASINTHVAAKNLQRSVGFIMSRIAADEAEILSIVVDKKTRRSGVARQLLTTHISSLAQIGVAAIFLEVDELNIAAIALYQQFGFQKVGVRKAYYQRNDGSNPSAHVMKRNLR